MIPKIIHYCWFGRNPKPALFEKCYKSWEKYCPDYQIIEWNEDNFDISVNDYVKEAFQAKKWAFVTDFARLWIVYHYGGIYLDTDVELIRPLTTLHQHRCFFGMEDSRTVATGLGFGAEPLNEVVKIMLEGYRQAHFVLGNGEYDLMTCPVRNTNSIIHILPEEGVTDVYITDGCAFYPVEYFCPLSADGLTFRKTKNTYSIHWYSASWLDERQMVVHEYRLFRNKCERIMGKRVASLFVRMVYLLRPSKRAILKEM